MRAGRIASLCLVVAVAAVSAALSLLGVGRLVLPEAHPLLQWCVDFGAVAASAALLVLPVGFALDRTAARLRSYLEARGAPEEPAATAATLLGPRWARPVTGVFVDAVEEFRSREQDLVNGVREAEIRLRVAQAEQRQTEAVLHALRDAVLVTNAFGDLVAANEAAGALLGFDPASALHKPLELSVRDAPLGQLIRETLETANFAERRHVEHEIEISGPDSKPQRKVFDVTLACVENHRHEVAGVVTILYDLTRIREISQMKSDFVSKASHELRTPLSSIRAYVEMLVDGEAADEPSRQEFYKIIQDETERLGRLIDNMLNISRIEAGIVQIEREDVDIKALVRRAAETLEPQTREKRISLNVKLAEVDLTVEGDRDMLFQVVLNLISNAVKYTLPGGRVTVTADSDNLTRSVVLSVADTGLGIPPDAIDRIFDKFYRVESYKRVAKGTGLGLSLCKHIVETLHHGQIGVESQLGMGSKFWVTIPMRYAGSQAAA